jgi:thiamine-phosphate pyrophosphorylase
LDAVHPRDVERAVDAAVNDEMSKPARGRLDVHVITSGRRGGADHVAIARAAVRGGADVVQLRAPGLPDADLMTLAAAIRAACPRGGPRFVVNDRVDVAVASGADGVHLGQRDEFATARQRLGDAALLGISVEEPEQVGAAEAAGADYLGVTVFASGTKPEARPVGLHGVRVVVAATSLPVVGVGGVDASNAGDVIAAGAAGIAIVSAVASAADRVEATRELVRAVRAAKSDANP